jgi:hypothetical protein
LTGRFVSDAYCFFINADCSGTCYLAYDSGDVVPVKDTVLYTGQSWVKATGDEADVGSKAYASVFSGSCSAVSATLAHGRAITGAYTLPQGLSAPFAAPLTVKQAPVN